MEVSWINPSSMKFHDIVKLESLERMEIFFFFFFFSNVEIGLDNDFLFNFLNLILFYSFFSSSFSQ